MATDTAVASPPLPPAPAAARPAPAPSGAPADPTRHLWQIPVLLLGVALFVAAWQKWIPIGEPDPTSVFARQLSDLKGAYERTETDPVELKTRLSAVAGGVEAYPDLAARARFYLGSGYVRLAEVTPELD